MVTRTSGNRRSALAPRSSLVQWRIATREFGPRLGQPETVFGAAAAPVAQEGDRVDELEQLESPQHLRGVEQVAGQHRDHALFQLPGVARLAEHLLHHRTVEAVDEER